MDKRFERFLQTLKDNHFFAAVLNPGASFYYLTGLNFHLMERPTLLIFTVEGNAALILPQLEVTRAKNLPFETQLFPYGDNPANWQNSFNEAFKTLGIKNHPIAVEPTRLRYLEMEYIQKAAGDAQIKSGAALFENLRLIKDEAEIQLMQKAAHIAEIALTHTLNLFKPGMTELDLSSELLIQLLRAGTQGELPFSPIVSAGENSADPHATPTNRIIQKGDLLLIDYGASYQGYASDITRTFSVGESTQEFKNIAEIVKQSNLAGQKASQSGFPAGQVDRAAREVISASGFGEFFTHRTGHGLGLEAHEGPYMFAENNLILKPGMVHTVEPGIYLPGKGGVRIEDDIVVTETGSFSLTSLNRELIVLGD